MYILLGDNMDKKEMLKKIMDFPKRYAIGYILGAVASAVFIYFFIVR